MVYTPDFIKSVKPRTSAYRLMKAHLRGYSVMIPVCVINTTQSGCIEDRSEYGNFKNGTVDNVSKFTLEFLQNDEYVTRNRSL
jgi:hypothetical protein